jgi:hypothetical protein
MAEVFFDIPMWQKFSFSSALQFVSKVLGDLGAACSPAVLFKTEATSDC